ncbi:MAG: hypothetical protein Q7R33_02820 [Nitrosarchaeum sp.]|nr:hypothetical protein [Nitrosarchaeum sp.]
MTIDGYATHMQILSWVVETFKPKRILELGVGRHSTKYLLDHAESLTSVETTKKEWLDIVRREFGSHDSWTSLYAFRDQWLEQALKQSWDMVFVDCDEVSRPMWASKLQSVCPLIICHDTECQAYGWRSVTLNENFVWLDCTEQIQWTSIITSNPEVVTSCLKKWSSYAIGSIRQKQFLF